MRLCCLVLRILLCVCCMSVRVHACACTCARIHGTCVMVKTDSIRNNRTAFMSFLTRNGRRATLVVTFATQFSSLHAAPSSHTDHSHAVAAMPGTQGRLRPRYATIVLLFCHVYSQKKGASQNTCRGVSTRFPSPHAVPNSYIDRSHATTAMKRPQGRPQTPICSNCDTSSRRFWPKTGVVRPLWWPFPFRNLPPMPSPAPTLITATR